MVGFSCCLATILHYLLGACQMLVERFRGSRNTQIFGHFRINVSHSTEAMVVSGFKIVLSRFFY